MLDQEISDSYAISHNHLTKVVKGLVDDGFIRNYSWTERRSASRTGSRQDNCRRVVRRTEEGFQLADCPDCVLSQACGLTGVLAKGVEAMLAVFDGYTVEDLLTDKVVLRRLTKQQSPLGFSVT